jgi:hypothetical protein
MTNVMPGKKTYILVALAALAGLANYLSQVVSVGFDFGEFIKFVNTEAVTVALATIRLAIAKK